MSAPEAFVYGALDNEIISRWMRIPDDLVVWHDKPVDGFTVPLLGETLEKNKWAHGLCVVAPHKPQPPGWIDYNPELSRG